MASLVWICPQGSLQLLARPSNIPWRKAVWPLITEEAGNRLGCESLSKWFLNLIVISQFMAWGQLPAQQVDLAWLGLLSPLGNKTCLFIEARIFFVSECHYIIININIVFYFFLTPRIYVSNESTTPLWRRPFASAIPWTKSLNTPMSRTSGWSVKTRTPRMPPLVLQQRPLWKTWRTSLSIWCKDQTAWPCPWSTRSWKRPSLCQNQTKRSFMRLSGKYPGNPILLK